MKRIVLAGLAVLALSACREDVVETVAPIEMPADAVGHYCQMLLAHHDGPKGQIHLDGETAPLFFAQVRDTLGYLHMPEQSHAVRAAFVQDMAGAESWTRPASWIAAEKAIYVVGSDRMGGMGAPEFVPFSDEAAARRFIESHGGTVRSFADITAADVLNDGNPGDTPEVNDVAGRLDALSDAHQPHEHHEHP